ncbi:M23 family metallopeptidase [Pseudarthrobacter sp. NPDC092424]|uniref:M23 family metallopeptidase n=1 Tax=Pseudarthrobacter sp. NPDC092424 TaxID=3364415 RepID=UPI00382BE478
MRLFAVSRAAAAGALSLVLGTLLLPGGSGNSLPLHPGGPAAVVGAASRQAAGVVGAGMLAPALTANIRAAVDFPRTAVAAHALPPGGGDARGITSWNQAARAFKVLTAGAVRLPAGYLIAPLQVLVPTSPFGPRASPISGLPGDFHLGQDYAAACGTLVYAADSGVVRAAGWHPWGGGNRVEVDHGNGLVTTYNHLESIAVRPGDAVAAGGTIARVGSTGWSTGCHLHFEVILNGRHINPLTWTLLPLSALADLPPARPDAPALSFLPGTGNSEGGEPSRWPPFSGSTTTAPAPPATPASSAVPPPAPTPSAVAPPAAPPPTEQASPPPPTEQTSPPPPPPSPVTLEPAVPVPVPTDPAAPTEQEPAPAAPTPTAPTPIEPMPTETVPAKAAPAKPASNSPLPPEPPAGPALPGEEAPPSSAARATPGKDKCGQEIPSRDQYAGLPETNHQYGHLREDAACGIPVPNSPDPE